MPVLLIIDFPFEGPWGGDLAAARKDLARDIAAEPGLIWKVWTEEPDEGMAGGVYLFEDREHAVRYRDKQSARLAQMGVGGLQAKLFDVNTALSGITGAPLTNRNA